MRTIRDPSLAHIPLCIIGLLSCSEDPGSGTMTGLPLPGENASAPSASAVDMPAAGPASGSTLPAPPAGALPGTSAGMVTSPPATSAPVAPAAPANTPTEQMAAVGMEEMAGGEATGSEVAGGEASDVDEGGASMTDSDVAPDEQVVGEPMSPDDEAGEDEPVVEDELIVFQTAAGTIPNSPQPPSTTNLSVNQWRDGLISPSILEGHQINQPAVVNGYLVIGGNEEFWIYDVSDPTSPKELSAMTTPGRRPGEEAESHTISFARYGDDFYMVTIGGTGIDTWNITDPTAPRHAGAVRISGTNYGDYTEAIWGVTWQGQYIYVGATNNGIKVVDASNPAQLDVVAEVPTSQYGGVSAGALDAIGNVLVVTTPKESGGVATLDITNPENPTRLASFSTGTSYIGQFHRHWVFLIGPLRAWDVLSDPRNIGIGSSPMGTLPNDNAEYMTFSDDYMFLGHARQEINGTPGSSKIDVSDPRNMRVENRIWGRMDRGGVNDDQFNMPFGNIVLLGDDQAPYAGWVLGVHQSDPDSTPPEIDTVIPKPDSEGNSTRSRIGVTFSDNIDLATVNQASFFVRPVGGQPLPGKYGVRMSVLNFDPDEDLEPGTTYEVVLRRGGVADLVGNTLAADWTSTFTTN